jgi:predicted secreted protein
MALTQAVSSIVSHSPSSTQSTTDRKRSSVLELSSTLGELQYLSRTDHIKKSFGWVRFSQPCEPHPHDMFGICDDTLDD